MTSIPVRSSGVIWIAISHALALLALIAAVAGVTRGGF